MIVKVRNVLRTVLIKLPVLSGKFYSILSYKLAQLLCRQTVSGLFSGKNAACCINILLVF